MLDVRSAFVGGNVRRRGLKIARRKNVSAADRTLHPRGHRS